MSDEVVRRLPEWFVDRMRHWAMFRLGSGAYSVPSSWPSDGPIPGGARGTRYWRLLGTVHETQVAIDSLPPKFRQTVANYWRCEGSGHSLRDLARHRQVAPSTFNLWLRKGHALLFLEFRAARRRREQAAAQAREGKLVPRAA